MDYTLHGSLLLAHARPRRRRRVPQEPGRPAVLPVLRREHAALRHLRLGRQRSARCSTTPGRSPRASATPRASSAPTRRFFVVGGTSTANKIVWHGMVGRGDLVLCDRNCHKSILHSLIMTGATPIYLMPSRNGLGIIGPISQGPVHAASRSRKRSPPARSRSETSGKVRLMVMTNSTYDGLCYNVDAHQGVARRRGRGAALRRGLVRLRELPRVLRRLPRDLVGAPGPLAARDHLRDAVDAQAARGACRRPR